MCHPLRRILMLLSLATGLVAQDPSDLRNSASSVVMVEPGTTVPPLPMREALALAEKQISAKTHHVVLAELRRLHNLPHWALLFDSNDAVEDGAIWVTVDMERRVVTHGRVITAGPEPDLNKLPITEMPSAEPRESPGTAGPDSPKNVTLTALPIDMEALARLQGPQTFSHEGRIFRLDLTGWHWTLVCDGPHAGPNGAHVLGTYAKSLPGAEGEVHLTIWLVPRSAVDDTPFDPLPQTPERNTEKRLIAMGGQPGTLHLSSLERRTPSDPRSRIWYASAEQAGRGWLLRLEAEGTLGDSSPLVKALTHLAKSLRPVAGMPPDSRNGMSNR